MCKSTAGGGLQGEKGLQRGAAERGLLGVGCRGQATGVGLQRRGCGGGGESRGGPQGEGCRGRAAEGGLRSLRIQI